MSRTLMSALGYSQPFSRFNIFLKELLLHVPGAWHKIILAGRLLGLFFATMDFRANDYARGLATRILTKLLRRVGDSRGIGTVQNSHPF